MRSSKVYTLSTQHLKLAHVEYLTEIPFSWTISSSSNFLFQFKFCENRTRKEYFILIHPYNFSSRNIALWEICNLRFCLTDFYHYILNISELIYEQKLNLNFEYASKFSIQLRQYLVEVILTTEALTFNFLRVFQCRGGSKVNK